MNYEEIYRDCFRIRAFERKVEQAFSEGKLRGTTHGCIGQEIIPVAVMQSIDPERDYVVGTHRCHGQVLAYTRDIYRLACEMMGREDGFVKGVGGSQHIKTGRYLTNGITGGMVTVGTGVALGIQRDREEAIVIAFMGDGGFNEGYVQESLNLAAAMKLPILFVCENNHYAMSTPTARYSAGDFQGRIEALGMRYLISETVNPGKLFSDVRESFSYVRRERKPFFLDIQTARLCGHSKSDGMEYMTNEEKDENLKNDPIIWLKGNITESAEFQIREQVEQEINEAFEKAAKCAETKDYYGG